MGMWINNRLKHQLEITQEYIDKNINTVTYEGIFDVNDSSLLAPKNMKQAIIKLLDKKPPKNELELFASI